MNDKERCLTMCVSVSVWILFLYAGERQIEV